MGKSGRDWGTSIGGGPIDFPSTCWSRFLGRSGQGDAKDSEPFELLAKRYWKPVYGYVRIRWAKTNEDAKDLSQDFFVWMMESEFLSKAHPDRGRFRVFMKVALEHYLCNEEKKRRRQKRGGGLDILPLTGGPDDEAELQIPDAAGRTPGEVLDAMWKRELMTQATKLLGQQLKDEGKETCFRLFHDAYGQESDGVNYRELASKHGVSETDVFNQLRYARN